MSSVGLKTVENSRFVVRRPFIIKNTENELRITRLAITRRHMTPDESFKKKEHLLKTKDFRRVYKSGRSQRVGFIAAYCAENGLGHNRIGFSISARNIKQANLRNRIRRVFRETYRKKKKCLKTGFDIILVVKREPERTISYKDAEAVFLKIVKMLDVYA